MIEVRTTDYCVEEKYPVNAALFTNFGKVSTKPVYEYQKPFGIVKYPPTKDSNELTIILITE